jgi:pilus assembly protein Flp/PilA
MKIFKAFLRNTGGATSIEYAMIAAGISITIVAAARSIGTTVSTLYINKVAGNLT